MNSRKPGIVGFVLGGIFALIVTLGSTHIFGSKASAANETHVCVAGSNELCPSDDLNSALDAEKELQDETNRMSQDPKVKALQSKQRELFGLDTQLQGAFQKMRMQCLDPGKIRLQLQCWNWDEGKRRFIAVPGPTPPAAPAPTTPTAPAKK